MVVLCGFISSNHGALQQFARLGEQYLGCLLHIHTHTHGGKGSWCRIMHMKRESSTLILRDANGRTTSA